MTLALFDLDNTITRKDSMFRFIIFLRGWFFVILSSPFWCFQLLSLLLRIKDIERVKEAILGYFLSGFGKDEMRERAACFTEQWMMRNLNEDILSEMKKLLTEGADVCIVTASCDVWVMPFANLMGTELLCTEAAFDRMNRLTGKFKTPNCKGAEKVRRVKAYYELSQYDRIIVYGNHGSDEAMMELATERNYIG